MKNTLNKLILFLFTICCLASCDPGVSYQKVIENNSDHDILIQIHKTSGSSVGMYYISDSILLKKRTQTTILTYSRLGCMSEFKNCDLYCDSITSKVNENDSLHVTLDMSNLSNWQYTILKKDYSCGGGCECKLIITNDMIH